MFYNFRALSFSLSLPLSNQTKNDKQSFAKVHVLIVPTFCPVFVFALAAAAFRLSYIVIELFRFLQIHRSQLLQSGWSPLPIRHAQTSFYNIYYKIPNYIFSLEFIVRKQQENTKTVDRKRAQKTNERQSSGSQVQHAYQWRRRARDALCIKVDVLHWDGKPFEIDRRKEQWHKMRTAFPRCSDTNESCGGRGREENFNWIILLCLLSIDKRQKVNFTC